MYKSSTISHKELKRMLTEIVPVEKEEDLRKSVDIQLKNISNEKVENWPNTLKNQVKLEQDIRRQKFIENEQKRRQIDLEEYRYQQYNKNMRIQNAKSHFFDNQELIRNFRNKMSFCDMLSERETQIAQNKKIKERRKTIEKLLTDNMNNILEIQNIKEKEAERKKKIKIKEQYDIIKQQYIERKLKRVMDYQDDYIEGQVLKHRAIWELKKEEQKRKNNILKTEKMNEEFKKHNELLKKYKLQLKIKEDEQDNKIKEYENKKNILENLIITKQKEKQTELQNHKNKLIQQQFEYLENIRKKENEKIEKDIILNENNKIQEQNNKTELLNKMKKDIEHNRLLSIQNKINIKNKEKEEDAIMLQKYLDNMKIQEQKEKDNILNHKLKEKDINIYRLKQIQDKKNNAINQFNDLQQQYYNNQLLLQKDKDDFLDYAQNQINIYKNNGKNITPLMLELKLYRKKGLI